MKEIKEIVEDIHEELEGAKHYAMKAMEHKSTNREAADKYAEMAKQELGHIDKLHEMAVKLIEKHTVAGNAPPVAMKAVWDWEHERMIEHMGKIKALLDMYRA